MVSSRVRLVYCLDIYGGGCLASMRPGSVTPAPSQTRLNKGTATIHYVLERRSCARRLVAVAFSGSVACLSACPCMALHLVLCRADGLGAPSLARALRSRVVRRRARAPFLGIHTAAGATMGHEGWPLLMAWPWAMVIGAGLRRLSRLGRTSSICKVQNTRQAPRGVYWPSDSTAQGDVQRYDTTHCQATMFCVVSRHV